MTLTHSPAFGPALTQQSRRSSTLGEGVEWGLINVRLRGHARGRSHGITTRRPHRQAADSHPGSYVRSRRLPSWCCHDCTEGGT